MMNNPLSGHHISFLWALTVNVFMAGHLAFAGGPAAMARADGHGLNVAAGQSSIVGLQVARAQAVKTLAIAQNYSKKTMKDAKHWNFPLYMGANHVSQYYLFRIWLSAGSPEFARLQFQDFPIEKFRALLINSQLADGSWQATPEPNLEHGNLDATIMNYWALKAMNFAEDSAAQAHARQFILQKGGLERASVFVRIVLAMFAQISWSKVPWAPLFFVNPGNPSFMNIEQFPQWVRPHIVPIAYLRSMHVSRDLGPRFSISELNLNPVNSSEITTARNESVPNVKQRWVMNQIIKSQTALGSWGGYTVATLLSLAALSDYQARSGDPAEQPSILNAAARGLRFVDRLYLDTANPSVLLGTVCDGRYWDTILVLQGLLSSSVPPSPSATIQSIDTSAATSYLIQAQRSNGGIPFGLEFEATPDIDDTAELITTLRLAGGDAANKAANHAVDWLVSMQNNNGGWGAFDRNNTGNFLLRAFTAGLKDSVTLFDPSTPDVTGHALEALGASGATIYNSQPVKLAVSYLRNHIETAHGVWPGRWGVNYIYGTNAAISGLLRVGVSPSDPMVTHAVEWLILHQNSDGGFGETTQSDLDSRLAGRGISTPSQTAWALMLLVRAGHSTDFVSIQAVNYLNTVMNKQGQWIDSSVNGTGHSGIVYLMYPSYALAFPMIALGEFLRSTEKK